MKYSIAESIPHFKAITTPQVPHWTPIFYMLMNKHNNSRKPIIVAAKGGIYTETVYVNSRHRDGHKQVIKNFIEIGKMSEWQW